MLTLMRAAALLAMCMLTPRAQALELYYYNGTMLDTLPDPPPVAAPGRRPVLFVHGHQSDFLSDNDSNTDPNYAVNFIRRLDIGSSASLPSFDLAIKNNPDLNIEPYYIRFFDQARSISEDANDIAAAVDLIVQRHNPGFIVTNPQAPPPVQVAIIGYSKGTISARQYLQRLQGAVTYPDGVAEPDARPNYRPVSEFVAIAPPNHGLSVPWLRFTSKLSLQQLHNGRRGQSALTAACGEDYGSSQSNHFIEILNGDGSHDFIVPNTPFIAAEAPGSRCEGKPPNAGPLYVAIYAENNADFVGGDTSSGDCRGRKLARNLAKDAINIQIANIGGGDEIEVHQRTVHNPEVICKALYTVAHRRPPLERLPGQQTCAVDVEDVPIIPAPEGAAAMLTLDLSGSMLATGCTGCGSRLAMLRDAVTLFLETWWSLRPDDRVGVTYFRTSTTEPTFNGERMPTLASRAQIIQDLANTGPVAGDNLTAMGAGLQVSIAALQPLPPHVATRPHVILFSDGMQNVNPMVQPIPGEPAFEIASNPPTRLDECTGAPVNTIAIGTGQPFLDRLQQIATATGGQSSAIDDASGLRQMFIDQLIGTLSTSSPQLVAYRHGVLQADNATEQFAANATARKVLFSVSWQRGQTLEVQVFKNGVDTTSSARVASGPFYRILTFEPPGPAGGVGGQWEVRIAGPLGAPYEASAIVDEAALSYRVQLGSLRNLVGSPLDLAVQVLGDKRPVDGRVSVTAVLERPRVAVGNLLEQVKAPGRSAPGAEPKSTIAEQKLAALIGDIEKLKEARSPLEAVRLASDGNGGFRAALPNATVPGLYRVTLRIAGEDGKLGAYERQATVSAIVRFAEAEFRKSNVTARTTKGGGTEITLRPRDKHGNLLGPGLASEVQLAVSSGRVDAGPEDLGDGGYRFRVTMPKTGNSTIMLVVAERLLFRGTLKQLQVAARK
jgi:hypothetical protein